MGDILGKINRKFISDLIQDYASKGISLSNVLDHPDFQRLTIQQQAEAVKLFGNAIKSGTKLDSAIIKGTIGAVIRAGYFAGIQYLASHAAIKSIFGEERRSINGLVTDPDCVVALGTPYLSNVKREHTDRMVSAAGGLLYIATGAELAGVRPAISNLVKEHKITKEIRNTDFNNMKESDAIKFLARISTLRG